VAQTILIHGIVSKRMQNTAVLASTVAYSGTMAVNCNRRNE